MSLPNDDAEVFAKILDRAVVSRLVVATVVLLVARTSFARICDKSFNQNRGRKYDGNKRSTNNHL
jgi:hypothetical protein